MLLEAGADAVVWEFIRASGLAAYILLTVSVALGLSVSARAIDFLSKRAHINEAHQTLSVLAGVLIGLHVVLLLAHGYVQFSLVDLAIPFASSWRPYALVPGIIATYVVGGLLLTSAMRPRIGHRWWRLAHYAAMPAWALATVHGVLSGTDSGMPAVQYMYLASFAVVVLLVAFSAAAGRRPVSAALKGP